MVHNASAHPADQPKDSVALVLALWDAFNSADAAALDTLLDASFTDVITNPPPSAPPELVVTSRQGYIDYSVKEHVHVAISNCKQTAPDTDTVVCDATASGGSLPPLPHPFTQTVTFPIANGKIMRQDAMLSDQTSKDLAAFFASAAQPGMPVTGAADMGMPISALVVALMALVAGTLLRRAHTTPR